MSFCVRFGVENRSLPAPSLSMMSGSDSENFEGLLNNIANAFALPKGSFRLTYFDEEHEKISVSCWNDFKVAMEEHAAMKKIVQLYGECGDDSDPNDESNDDCEDLVLVNNSPNVMTNQEAHVDAKLAPASSSASASVSVYDGAAATQTKSTAATSEPQKVSQGSASNASFWSRLFGTAAPSAANQKCAQSSADVSAEICPTLSMLLLSDLGELLTQLRVEAINQLEFANTQQLSASLYGKVNFQRTLRVFEEELAQTLTDIRSRAQGQTMHTHTHSAPEQKAQVLEVEDALAAIEKEKPNENEKEKQKEKEKHEEKKEATEAASKDSANATSGASYASVVAASIQCAVASEKVESKLSELSSPVAFSMSAESVSQVLSMCRELGFKADAAKVKYFMSKSNGDYAALIDWLMTDSLIKLNVPK